MIPYTSKFYSNGTIFDSIGSRNAVYEATYSHDNVIYYLKSGNNIVDGFNTDTEVIEQYYTQLADIKIAGDVGAAVLTGLDANSIAADQYGNVKAFRGFKATPYAGDSVLYTTGNTLVREYLDESAITVLLSTHTYINDFQVDAENNYYVIHQSNRVTKFSQERLKQYSLQVTAELLSSIMPLTADPQLIAIDCVSEYTSAGKMTYPIVLGTTITEQMFLAKIDELSATVTHAKMIPASGYPYAFGDDRRINYNLTNYNYLARRYAKNKNTITFKLTLKNIYNNRDIHRVSMPIDISKFTVGSHHFAFRLDTVYGKVSILVDGKKIQEAAIPQADFTFQDIAYDSMCLGTTYFNNNITLPQKLNQPDRYMINNCKIKQFKIYDKAIDDDNIRFLTYNNTQMGDLLVSLPCGQRNEVEQIERIFSFNVPGSKSNNINIVIKNSDISNETIQNQIRDVVVERLKKVLPATTKINQITFKNSKPTFNNRVAT